MADYFQQCASANAVSVPDNYGGYQQPHSGVAYAGLTVWLGAEYREYIETPLTSTLVQNNCYHFEMYINQPNHYPLNNSDDIQVYFSDTIVNGVGNALTLPFVPQISNSIGNFPDTVNWTLVSANYIATGGENYLIIGNFKNDSNTNVIGTVPPIVVFFFVDDVSLTECTTGLNDLIENNISLYPNPFSNQLAFTLANNETTTVSLYNLFGQQVLHQTFTNSTTLNTEQLVSGIYFYELRDSKGAVKTGKVVKE